jgi:SAM-dependent methyltransferase
LRTLDLGCGANPRNPFNADETFGVDIRDLGGGIRKANLFIEPIPFDDGYFNFVSAYDFIEHVPRVLSVFNSQAGETNIIYPFINLMNEIYRVLVPGGYFYSRTPAYPHPEAFQDPTHVNIITEQTFPLYFNDKFPVAHIYGFEGGFQIQELSWEGFYLVVKMIKTERPNLERFLKY